MGCVRIHDLLRKHDGILLRRPARRVLATLVQQCLRVVIEHVAFICSCADNASLLAFQGRNYNRCWVFGLSRIVIFGIDEQIRNFASPEEPVVDGARGGELFDLRDADGVEELQDVGLAVVADEIVAGARAADLLYYGLAWMPCS